MKFIMSFILGITLFLSVVGDEIRERPKDWAEPVPCAALGNFYKINDNVYRSAQPDSRGYAELEKMGIKEILNLREYHSDADEAKGTTLKLHHVSKNAENIKDEDVVRALKIIKDAKGPILIHCMHGADRTGLICAMYRVLFDGWTKEKAIDEMINGNYNFHEKFKNIPEYIRNANIEAIKKEISRP